MMGEATSSGLYIRGDPEAQVTEERELSGARTYLETVRALIDDVILESDESIDRASRRIADSLASGGVLHVFGSGHGMIFAKEAFNRSGGLIPVNPIYDAALLGPFGGARKTQLLQDVEAYAPAVFAGYDLRSGEVLLIFSSSGNHPLVVELCLEAQRRLLHVIAVTNLAYSRRTDPRHSSGKRLFEVADDVIDNPGPDGDAAVMIDGLPSAVGATSTITGIALLNAVVVATIRRLVDMGIDPPILYAHHVEGGAEHNREVFERYRDRLRHL